MSYNITINPQSEVSLQHVESIIHNFSEAGKLIGDGKRNVIKIVEIEGKQYNVKSFKVPNLFNKFAYKFFRKGKAQRSFEYAIKLKALGVLTPEPQAYAIEKGLLFGRSFYVSQQQEYDYTIRKMIDDPKCEDFETVVRAFTRFTFDLHEKGIHFIDHSPGNTLIKKQNDAYSFYLVDLNRMNFGTLNFKTRIKNFARLSANAEMIEIMSDEYAQLINKPKEEVHQLMQYFSQNFRFRFERKKRLKKRFKLSQKTR